MKKVFILLAVAVQLTACNSKKQDTVEGTAADSTEIATEKQETDNILVFEGELPCADCSGIETILKIDNVNNKFELSSIYKGKSPEKKFTQKGNLNTERGLENDQNGTIYILNWDKPENEQVYYGYYSKDPETLYMLDKNRKVIKSKLNYTLNLNE